MIYAQFGEADGHRSTPHNACELVREGFPGDWDLKGEKELSGQGVVMVVVVGRV